MPLDNVGAANDGRCYADYTRDYISYAYWVHELLHGGRDHGAVIHALKGDHIVPSHTPGLRLAAKARPGKTVFLAVDQGLEVGAAEAGERRGDQVQDHADGWQESEETQLKKMKNNKIR